MANLPRTPKSGNEWTQDDLRAYNITVSSQSPDTFYGTPFPTLASLTTLDPHLVSGTLNTQGLSQETKELLLYIDLAPRAMPYIVSGIQNLIMGLLRALGYEKYIHLLRSRRPFPLLICGDPEQSVQADVSLMCVTESFTTVLVAQGCKPIANDPDPEPQVIAAAIAVFQCNNRRRGEIGQPQLQSMTVPAITMTGARPVFYLVPVTEELSVSVATAEYPFFTTEVKKCVVAIEGGHESEGMKNLDFRQLALRHFAAFRTLAETHWSAFMTAEEMEEEEMGLVEEPIPLQAEA